MPELTALGRLSPIIALCVTHCHDDYWLLTANTDTPDLFLCVPLESEEVALRIFAQYRAQYPHQKAAWILNADKSCALPDDWKTPNTRIHVVNITRR